MPGTRTIELVELAQSIADDGEEFFYLGGPMTGKRHFNFERFEAVTHRLRDAGYVIVSPVELDDFADPARARLARASETGHAQDLTDVYGRMLARDFQVISLPTCVGGIFLEGWLQSKGASAEARTLSFLGKPVLSYSEEEDGIITLSVVHDPGLGLEEFEHARTAVVRMVS